MYKWIVTYYVDNCRECNCSTIAVKQFYTYAEAKAFYDNAEEAYHIAKIKESKNESELQ